MISKIVGSVKFPQLISHCQSVTNLLSHEHMVASLPKIRQGSSLKIENQGRRAFCRTELQTKL